MHCKFIRSKSQDRSLNPHSIYLNKHGGRNKDENVFNAVTVKSPSGVFIQEVSSEKSEDFKQIMDYVNDHFYFNPIDKSAQKIVQLSKEDLLENLGGGRMVLINDEWYLFRESYLEDNIYQISKKHVNNNMPRYSIDRTRTDIIGKGTIEELMSEFKMYDIKHYLVNGKEHKY